MESTFPTQRWDGHRVRSPRRTRDSPQSHEGHEGKSPILLGDLCALVVRAFPLPTGRKRPVPKSHQEIRVVTQSLCSLISYSTRFAGGEIPLNHHVRRPGTTNDENRISSTSYVNSPLQHSEMIESGSYSHMNAYQSSLWFDLVALVLREDYRAEGLRRIVPSTWLLLVLQQIRKIGKWPER